jgi:hypothetical protein
MTVTISYKAFLLTLVAGVGIAALIYFIMVLARINRAVGRLDTVIDRTDSLLGSLKTLSEESTTTVVAARHLVEQSQGVMADFSAVSARMHALAESDASRALSLIERIKSFVAIFAGVKTAFASVKHFMERRRHAAEGYEDH